MTPPAIFLAIDRAMRTGAMGEAVRLARQALDEGLRDPVLFNLRAWWHEREGRPAQALADLETVGALAPGNPRTLVAMGRCLAALGRGGEALPCLDAAIAASPGMAEAFHEKGVALERLGELVPARAAYEDALALAPEAPETLARLAGLAARRSDWAGARALADRAAVLSPGHAGARLARVTADLGTGDFAAAESGARALAAAAAAPPDMRAHARNLLGDALDGAGRHAEAFAAWAAARAGIAALFADQFAARETGLALARRQLREMAGMDAARWADDAPEDAPVFLMGFPRAGTTLLGQILASHPRVVTLEEKPLLLPQLAEFVDTPGGLARLGGLSAETLAHHRAQYRDAARRAAGGDLAGRVVVDQTPLHSLHLPLLARLFPGAHVVFALRDPRDVVLSCFRQMFALNRYTWEFRSLGAAATFYDAAMRLAEAGRVLPLSFHDVRNEDLVEDFGGTVRALCDALELSFDPAMAGFAQAARGRAIATPSAAQVARGLSAAGIGRWRNHAAEMSGVMPLLASWVEKFGYR
jgi:Flp pilus assembly protein TadD